MPVRADDVKVVARQRLTAALDLADVGDVFPWQLELLDRMLAGQIPSALDIPTGLGKTAVIAIWLAARSVGAKVPRRLVYVVDRRAVVDQASEVADDLRKLVECDTEMNAALGLEPAALLPISTLRGQFLDNRAWLEDPSSLAIVVGTVDMIGSRLLFAGYGVSKRMRPYHAGLLGADSLIILDEAHLVPPFEHMLRTVTRASDHGLGAGDPSAVEQIPPVHLLTLSATGRADGGALTLGEADRAHPIVAQRLRAPKAVSIREGVGTAELASRLIDEASALTVAGTKPVRCVVFCNRRADAEIIAAGLTRLVGEENVELLVGARRVYERSRVADWLRAHGYLSRPKTPLEKAAFVVATSAGEVGVDLDADHMISDLVAWERMVQRLGRVNRRGEGDAKVIVVPVNDDDNEETVARLTAARDALRSLSRTSHGLLDASPGSIVELKLRAVGDVELRDLISCASTPEPLRPALTRAHLEAWSMTSIEDEDHPGRPKVEPWLRGWEPEHIPQTTVVWREILPLSITGRILGTAELDEFLSTAGPELAEKLETETWNVLAWLERRLEVLAARGGGSTDATEREVARPLLRNDEVVAVILDGARGPWAISAQDLSNKDKRKDIEFRLQGATLIVDVRVGGLAAGLLSVDSGIAEDVTTLHDATGSPVIPLRVRRVTTTDGPPSDAADWREEERIMLESADDEVKQWLSLESHISVPARTENGRSVGPTREQKLEEHQTWTEEAALRIAARLQLKMRFRDALAVAARLHDEGKRARRWQRAFRAHDDAPYAKTRSRPNLQLLGRYRHELGSLPYAERDARVIALDDDLRDLCLHLIASHHGHARPSLRTDGAEEPPSKLEARAQEIALRFIRLEKRWGPWGLAWWESLLRAADQQASRRNDQEGGSRG